MKTVFYGLSDYVWTRTGCLWVFKKISNANSSLKSKSMPAELFPSELCISVSPVVPEKDKVFIFSFLSCLLCLTPSKTVLPSHCHCFLHGDALLSATLVLASVPCCLFGAKFITISIMQLVYKV